MKKRTGIRIFLLTSLALLCHGAWGQKPLNLDEVIRLAQDSAVTVFQSRQEYQSRQASYEAFEALRKPQLALKLVPNYSRIVSDPTRDYVYLRNYDIFSTSAQLRLSQKVLPLGGEAYVGTQAIWSEFFREQASGYPRQFVASPLLVGYSNSLLGYNPFRWEKLVEDQRMKAARQQHEYDLRRIAEEAAARYFRLLCRQWMALVRKEEMILNDTVLAIAREKATIAIVTQQELHAMELQLQNSANLLDAARKDEQTARTELASLLRLKEIPNDTALLEIPDMPSPISYTAQEVAAMAVSNSPAYQQQLAELTEARQQEAKARKERGINVGLDVNLGLQQVNNTFGSAYKNQQMYALGSVQVTIPLMDHGAAKKRHAAAQAWGQRQESALQETERLLAEDAIATLQKLQDSRRRLENTQHTIELAEAHFYETVESYSNGLCDINTFSLGQNRWVTAYTNYLNALEEFWTNHYHLQTLIQHE